VAVMGLDGVAHNGESKSIAHALAPSYTTASKGFEDDLALFLGDAGAAVVHRDLDLRRIRNDRHFHDAIFRGPLDGVGHEVAQGSKQRFAIRANNHRPLGVGCITLSNGKADLDSFPHGLGDLTGKAHARLKVQVEVLAAEGVAILGICAQEHQVMDRLT
jgi:hypothetical protein